MTERASKTGLLLVIAAVGLFVATLAGAGIAVVAWKMTSETRVGEDPSPIIAPVSPPALPPGDPLRPEVALTLTGACSSLRFDSVLRVSTAAGSSLRMIAITALDHDVLTGSLSIQGAGPLDRPVTLGGGPSNDALINLSAGGTNLWNSGLNGASGTIRFHRWQPDGGIAEITFEQVVLPHMSGTSTCTVNGHVTTRGITNN